ncbi:hypothetical protein FBUS_04360 [Fasciolopsis buskii]|uniref:SH2 domain-containing protein n=1 Tax=Fasciolopsis buskii TaxID=27845 RepID=A0A8E0RX76_9TREM|nr:hypothetical protein FBUS_04360 [Fasciolopsis buski]
MTSNKELITWNCSNVKEILAIRGNFSSALGAFFYLLLFYFTTAILVKLSNFIISFHFSHRPISIVRVLEDLNDHSSGINQISPPSNTSASVTNQTDGYRSQTIVSSLDDKSDNPGEQDRNTIQIRPWSQTNSGPYGEPNVEEAEDSNISSISSLKKPSGVDYVREISIPAGSNADTQGRGTQTVTKSIIMRPFNGSRPPIVLERPSDSDYDPPDSPIRGTVISRPSYLNSNHSNGDQNDSNYHRTIHVNGVRNSFVTLSTPEVPGDSDTSDSDIQPSGLQRFPRLTLEDPNSGSFFRIREPPSPQSTPSLPRRALSNQTLHLKQPVQPDTSTQTTNIEQQSHRQNSENSTSDQTSVTLKHRVAPEILRRTEQLYRYVSQPSPAPVITSTVTSTVDNTFVKVTTPLPPNPTSRTSTTIINTNPTPATYSDGSWFRRSEAANLMRDFGLPMDGLGTASPEQTFSRVPRWFHGTIDRSRAEQLLRQVDLDGAFLVRVDPLAQRYVISVLWAGQVSHVLVSVITPESHSSALGPSYQLYGLTNVDQFSSLRELVQYYATHPLATCDHQMLLYAVGQAVTLSGVPDYAELFYPSNSQERRTRV